MGKMELAARLLLSLFLGALVGIERQWHHKHAGLKTNTLVAVGATAFALVSAHGFGPNSNPAQIAAGVVTGIGFIGAGVIMRRGASVQGINSAATLWASASMGLAIGAGYYSLAWLVAAVIVAIQFVVRWLANWIDRRSGPVLPNQNFRLVVHFQPAVANDVRAAWAAFSKQTGVSVLRYSEATESDSRVVLDTSFALSEALAGELDPLFRQLASIGGVTRREWSQAETREDE